MGEGGLAAASVANTYGNGTGNTVTHYYDGPGGAKQAPKKKKRKLTGAVRAGSVAVSTKKKGKK